ncbi:MAG: hypothetical protein MJK12_00790 [Colwellia sp.]|nr:hypothetical protein [Colwellia sp.]
MSRLLNNFQQSTLRHYANFASFILIALISMQSAFAVADSCLADLNNKEVSEPHLQINDASCKAIEISLIKKSAEEQMLVDDNCLDCDGKCCPCCSNVMFTLTHVNNEVKTSGLLYFTFESIQLSPRYYLLLRPPKLSEPYIS